MTLHISFLLRTSAYLLLVMVGSSFCDKIGETCANITECNTGSFANLECEQQQCICSIEVEYNSALEPSCVKQTGRCLSTPSCSESNTQCSPKKDCVCADGYVRMVNKGCTKVRQYKDLFESCIIISNAEVDVCKHGEKSTCKSGKCICNDNLYVNQTSGQCEPRSEYIKEFKLDGYNVKPGQYCANASDCISGLECKDFRCSCPTDCEYVSSRDSCDCGTIGVAIGPLLVGIILALGIALCWYCVTKKTIENFKEKQETLQQWQNHGLYNIQSESPPGNSPQPPPPVGLSNPAGPYGTIEPVPPQSADTLPVNPGASNDSHPGQNLPYPSNGSQNPDYAPPPYSSSVPYPVTPNPTPYPPYPPPTDAHANSAPPYHEPK